MRKAILILFAQVFVVATLAHGGLSVFASSSPTNLKVEYDKKYLAYYDFFRVEAYLNELHPQLKKSGYTIETIGKSVEGRKIYAILPLNMEPNKKTILVTVRHHGNEGSANWVSEGLLNKAFSNPELLTKMQFIIYPCINPDGAEAHTRNNANNVDLNRQWRLDLSEEVDEVAIVHKHLQSLMAKNKPDVVIGLDMHGHSKTDLVYRSPKNRIGEARYGLQSNFIDALGELDELQKGSIIPSEGKSGMMRLILESQYNFNVITHETLRDIPKHSTRSVSTLKNQGNAICDVILNIWG